MSASYKQDEKQLLMANNGLSIKMSFLYSKDRKIKLTIFYKSRKLSNFIIKNKVHSRFEDINDRHHVDYQYSCNRVGFESTQTYISYCKVF